MGQVASLFLVSDCLKPVCPPDNGFPAIKLRSGPGGQVTRGDVMGMGGKDAVYLVAVLGFDSVAAIGAGMASAEGQATAADLANFAQAGVDVMMGDTKMI